jgi:hypothetical protein
MAATMLCFLALVVGLIAHLDRPQQLEKFSLVARIEQTL